MDLSPSTSQATRKRAEPTSRRRGNRLSPSSSTSQPRIRVLCRICAGYYTRSRYHIHTRSIRHQTAVNLQSHQHGRKRRHPRDGVVHTRSYGSHLIKVVFCGYEEYKKLLALYQNRQNARRSLIHLSSSESQSSSGSDVESPSAVNSPSTSSESSRETSPFTHECEVAPDSSYPCKKTKVECREEIADFVNFYRAGLKKRLAEALVLHNSLKVNVILNLTLSKIIGTNLEYETIGPRASAREVYYSTNLDEWIEETIDILQTKYEENTFVGSNWTLEKCVNLELHIRRYTPLGGASYIQLPEAILNRQAVINIQNNDQRCFFYSIACRYLPRLTSHKERCTHYTTELFAETGLDFSGMNEEGPTTWKEIATFEKRNKCSVNLYGLTRSKIPKVYPLRISKFLYENNHFDLLYLTTDAGNSHYCYISNLSALVRSQKCPSGGGKLHICRACLYHFSSKEHLARHMSICCKFRPVKPSMPIEGKTDFIGFTTDKLKLLQYVPYVIYADFETCLMPLTPKVHFNTRETHFHKPTSFCYYVVSRVQVDETEYKPVLYRGLDAVEVFWKKIQAEARKLFVNLRLLEQPLILDEMEEKLIRVIKDPICHLCKKGITAPEIPVFDHDHLARNLRAPGEKPSNFRGLAHSTCNLAFRLPNYLPVIFHNGSKYDFRLLLGECASEVTEGSDREDEEEDPRSPRPDPKQKQKTKRRKLVRNSANPFLDLEAQDEDGNDSEDAELDEDETASLNGFINDEPEESDVDSDDEHAFPTNGLWRVESSEESTSNETDHDDYESASYSTRSLRRKMNFLAAKKFTVLATSAENFISFEKFLGDQMKLRFLDSYRFLSEPLSSLAEWLPKSAMKHVRRFYPTEEEFEVCSRKGVFPYEYMSDFSKYDEPTLPRIEDFFSSLTGQGITLEEYEFAQHVFRLLQCETLGHYSDHYQIIDVLLLTDVFESFRETCFNIYTIDPAHCYSAPSLSFNAMLKTIGRCIPLLTDYNKQLVIERGIRGGFCNVSKRYVRSNNRLMGTSSFDKNLAEKEKYETYLTYFDANNLYGFCLSDYLPCGDYEWVPWNEMNRLQNTIGDLSDTSEYGYVVDCDLYVPTQFHNVYADFPLAPEKLSLSIKKSVPPKLIATLHHKERYVVHYRYLKTMLRYGLKLVRIHQAIKFSQAPWMKTYVDLNTILRSAAKNKFEREFFKLMINSCYGKMLEGARGKRDFKLVDQPHIVQKWVNKPNFKSSVLLKKEANLFLIELAKTHVRFNRPLIVGMTVLDLAKAHMTEFHYGVMKPLFADPHQIYLAYTDTDSFIYEIKLKYPHPENLYQILKTKKEYFDFSEYPEGHICKDGTNEKVLGKFKDEAKGELLLEFIGLRPKLYSLKYFEKCDLVPRILPDGTSVGSAEPITVKKAKGVKKGVVALELSSSNYEEALFQNKMLQVEQTIFRSKNCRIKTIVQRKLALSRNDDKRYIVPNQAINTLPWGHNSIPVNADLVLQAREKNPNPQKYLVPKS